MVKANMWGKVTDTYSQYIFYRDIIDVTQYSCFIIKGLPVNPKKTAISRYTQLCMRNCLSIYVGVHSMRAIGILNGYKQEKKKKLYSNTLKKTALKLFWLG